MVSPFWGLGSVGLVVQRRQLALEVDCLGVTAGLGGGLDAFGELLSFRAGPDRLADVALSAGGGRRGGCLGASRGQTFRLLGQGVLVCAGQEQCDVVGVGDAELGRDVTLGDRSRQVGGSLLGLLGPEFVTDGLMRLAMTANKESTKLGALIALGKVAGIDLFRETTRVERVDRTAEDVDRELKAKLQALMNGMTIEGSASSVPASPASSAPIKPQPAAARDRRRKPTPG